MKPGSFPNYFNLNGHSVIPVAIFGSATLDVNEIDVETLSLQGMTVKVAGRSSKYLAHTEDVNNDGYMDVIVQFEDNDGWLEPNKDYLILGGNFYDGTPFLAGDTICVVPPGD